VTLRTFVIRPVATAWQVPHLCLKAFESPATNATGTLEVGSVSTITRNVQPRKIACAITSDFALRVE